MNKNMKIGQFLQSDTEEEKFCFLCGINKKQFDYIKSLTINQIESIYEFLNLKHTITFK